ncbi:WSC domain-containing protein [Mycena floridula]|nr:WSC domain-containing protein [Mycena floridula]
MFTLVFSVLLLSPGLLAVIPANWAPFGCFTDISTSRTLAATTFTDPANLTIESCIAFCSSSDYLYSGVEFGQECYCDSAIQVPGVQAPSTECNMPCKGNSSEVCGAGNRLSIFSNTAEPLPVIPQSVGTWVYQGCFTDSIQNRTLSTGINIPAGVSASTCTATCQTAGFPLAGLENSRECWCGTSVGPTTQHVSDNDCRAVCSSDHTQYCGNANRLAIYRNTNGPGGAPQGQCTMTSITNFTLQAVYNVPPIGQPARVPLKLILVEMVPSVIWAILSACTTCCTSWPTFSLQNSVFMPRSVTNPIEMMVSSSPGDGESPNFVASNPAFPGFQAWCGLAGNVLAFGGKSDAFSLCPNNTANGRLDVVFQPVTGHPHYALSECDAVTIVFQ